MMKKILALIIFISIFDLIHAQQFSVLTCSKGKEVYSTFGHSAIRYQDSSQRIDWVYNYGLFEFSDPNFIPKFCQGKLDYMIGKETINDFMGQYIYQGREVREQVLNLNSNQRDSLLKFLEWNILDENKYYRYDFLFDNCATKIIEVLENNCGLKFQFYKDPDPKSFRQLIHFNAEKSVPWVDWGMDIGLGNIVDAKASSKQYCFLPEYIEKSIQISNLASEPRILIPSQQIETKENPISFPILFSIMIGLIFIYHKFKPSKLSFHLTNLIMMLFGVGGIVIFLLWFFTEHSVTKMNWNLTWLNPLFIIYAISLWLNRDLKWVKRIISLFLTLGLIAIIFNFQDFHLASKIILTSFFIYQNVHFFKRINLKNN